MSFTYCWVYCAAQYADSYRVDISNLPRDSPVDALAAAICRTQRERGFAVGVNRILDSSGNTALNRTPLLDILVDSYSTATNPVVYVFSPDAGALSRLERVLERAESVLGRTRSTSSSAGSGSSTNSVGMVPGTSTPSESRSSSLDSAPSSASSSTVVAFNAHGQFREASERGQRGPNDEEK